MSNYCIILPLLFKNFQFSVVLESIFNVIVWLVPYTGAWAAVASGMMTSAAHLCPQPMMLPRDLAVGLKSLLSKSADDTKSGFITRLGKKISRWSST